MRWALLLLLLAACSAPPRPPEGQGLALVVGYAREEDVERAAEGLSARGVEWLPALKAARLRLPPGFSLEEAKRRLRPLGFRYVEGEGQRSYGPLPEALGVLGASPYAWHLQAVRAEEAWGVSTGAGVKVAVLDTGVDATHPALRGRVAEGLDAATGEPLPVDTDQSQGEVHGTHVAALAVGEGVGVAPGAVLLPVRVFSPEYVGDFQVAQALVWAVDQGAQVINLSFGGSGYSHLLHEAVNYALERLRVVVAAAGNQGSVARFYPAALPGVMAVGAADGRGNPAWFSNRGGWVGVWAPGVRIYSAFPGGGYGLLSGTSMAAPTVSGIAALLKSGRPFLEPFAVRWALKAAPGPDAVAALQASPTQRSSCLYLQVFRGGEGVAGADLALEGPEVYYAQSDDRGEARFLQIAPGNYLLRVAAPLPEGRRYYEENLTLGPSSCLVPKRILF
ncbi:S8 family serine peptidase [Thermus sp. NEB1569]|uniref:S8 family serine peptidase n=1 Tax=Thermus sp. NEB1569 TaxID=2918899 RepID=UPI001EFBD68B|nr:S8 family serine peptidase [Thermus sp. NEB1569]ULR40939.1 S8 family serine peptidase [Thermus sp. NEB1569]